MRSTVLATLILAPVLAHAQASTQVTGSLQARAEAPNSLLASAAPAADAVTSKIRVSTGVSEPRLIGTPHIAFTENELDRQSTAGQKVVVALLVDQNGNTEDVEVVKSLNKAADEKVVAAVKQFHFVPAKLDSQAIPVHVNLSIVLQP